MTVSIGLSVVCVLVTLNPNQRDVGYRWEAIHSNRPGRWTVAARYPRFSGTSPFIVRANRWFRDAAQKSVHDFIVEAKKDAADYKPREPYFYDDKVIVSLARTDLISVYNYVDEDTGGAHPNRWLVGHTLAPDPKLGAKSVWFNDLFLKRAKARSTVSRIVMQILKGFGAMWVQDGTLKELDAAQAEVFVVTPHGLTFLFSPYVAGPYVQGEFYAKVPFSKIATELDPAGPLRSLVRVLGAKDD